MKNLSIRKNRANALLRLLRSRTVGNLFTYCLCVILFAAVLTGWRVSIASLPPRAEKPPWGEYLGGVTHGL